VCDTFFLPSIVQAEIDTLEHNRPVLRPPVDVQRGNLVHLAPGLTKRSSSWYLFVRYFTLYANLVMLSLLFGGFYTEA
jgi:hypothetical protein